MLKVTDLQAVVWFGRDLSQFKAKLLRRGWAGGDQNPRSVGTAGGDEQNCWGRRVETGRTVGGGGWRRAELLGAAGGDGQNCWAVQAGLTPLAFAPDRLSPLAAFTSGAYFRHSERR